MRPIRKNARNNAPEEKINMPLQGPNAQRLAPVMINTKSKNITQKAEKTTLIKTLVSLRGDGFSLFSKSIII